MVCDRCKNWVVRDWDHYRLRKELNRPAMPCPECKGTEWHRLPPDESQPMPSRLMQFMLYAAMVAAIVLILFATLGVIKAFAETSRTFTNSLGQEVGRSTTRGNTTTFSNERGQAVGRSEQRGPVTNYFNDKGQAIGTSRGSK